MVESDRSLQISFTIPLGKDIARLRERGRRRTSQRVFGELSARSTATIFKVEKGERNLSPEAIFNTCDTAGISETDPVRNILLLKAAHLRIAQWRQRSNTSSSIYPNTESQTFTTTDSPKQNIRQMILYLRHSSGLTREEFAERSGISISTLEKLTNGQRVPTPVTSAKMCEGLNIPEVLDTLLLAAAYQQIANARKRKVGNIDPCVKSRTKK